MKNVTISVLILTSLFESGWVGVAVAQNVPPTSAGGVHSTEAFIQKWDRSGKGLLGLGTIDNAAIVKFELLDTKHAGRLTTQQLAGILTPQEFDVANPDQDSTIGVDEWLDLVKHRFARANTDHDGTLDARELEKPAGQELLKLVY
jgi:hypothetical protein